MQRESGVDEPINLLDVEYNCTKNSITVYAPYFLLFGRKPRLPIDLILSPTVDANEDSSRSKYVKDWKTQMSEANQKALQNSSHRKEKDIARNKMFKKLSPGLEQADRVLIRNMSGRGRTGKMRSFWEEKIHVVLENIKNGHITYNVKPEKDTNGRIRFPHRNIVLPCDNLFDNFNWNIKTELNHKKQDKKTASRQLPKKNDNEEESVTENKDDGSEMGEMIEFTPREIQIFSKKNNDKIEKEKKSHKIHEKVNFSIELEKSRRELPREKVERPKGNEKLIAIDDGSQYCETEGRKMEDKDQGGIKRRKEKSITK